MISNRRYYQTLNPLNPSDMLTLRMVAKICLYELRKDS